MFYKILTILLLILVSTPAFSYDIKDYCRQVADAVGGSYQIEKSCREQERESKANIEKMSVPERIDKYCESVGEAVGGSYQIKESCIKEELKAKESME